MTIGGWIVFGLLAFSVAIGGLAGVMECDLNAVAVTIVCILIIAAILFCMLWYFNNTADGQRALVDEKSNIGNGLDRTITIYTADGEVIATYTGKIDIETNDGGYIKFDFEGKRYIYYNCFVESIAVIEED